MTSRDMYNFLVDYCAASDEVRAKGGWVGPMGEGNCIIGDMAAFTVSWSAVATSSCSCKDWLDPEHCPWLSG